MPPSDPGTPCVYILASKRNGTLYVGATSDLPGRIWQHKADIVPGFTRNHGVHRLVWYEPHSTMESAYLREKRLKRWRRTWKLRLIEQTNPTWRDLYPEILSPRHPVPSTIPASPAGTQRPDRSQPTQATPSTQPPQRSVPFHHPGVPGRDPAATKPLQRNLPTRFPCTPSPRSLRSRLRPRLLSTLTALSSLLPHPAIPASPAGTQHPDHCQPTNAAPTSQPSRAQCPLFSDSAQSRGEPALSQSNGISPLSPSSLTPHYSRLTPRYPVVSRAVALRRPESNYTPPSAACLA